jgi:hypothetical protein
MSSTTHTDAGGWSARRAVIWGFLAGVAITVPATMLALLSSVGETFHPFLVPAAALLAPLSDAAADWPGLVNVALAALVNGVVYAVVAGSVSGVMTAARRG